jgi:hypothetical protein
MGLELSEEELDELSKKTLGSYINKASNHRVYLAKKDKDAERAQEYLGLVVSDSRTNAARTKAARKAVHDASVKASVKISDDRTKISNKDYNRQDGIRRAVKKLTKENAELMGLELSEEELDELKKHKNYNDEHEFERTFEQQEKEYDFQSIVQTWQFMHNLLTIQHEKHLSEYLRHILQKTQK